MGAHLLPHWRSQQRQLLGLQERMATRQPVSPVCDKVEATKESSDICHAVRPRTKLACPVTPFCLLLSPTAGDQDLERPAVT